MNNPNVRVGGEIDAFCTKCELNLAHTILAMVGTTVKRVRCNTCGTDRVFRGEQPIKPAQSFARQKEKKPSKKSESASRSVTSWTARVEAKDPATAKKYSPQTTFAVEDLVDHGVFGLGIVSGVRADKVDIAFKAFEKTLVHGKGGAVSTGPKPAFQPPAPTRLGPADKPPSGKAYRPPSAVRQATENAQLDAEAAAGASAESPNELPDIPSEPVSGAPVDSEG